MRILVFFIALTGVLNLLSAITGIQSIRGANPGVTITHHTTASRVVAFAVATACAAALYGIYKRARIVWTLGWAILAAAWAEFLFSMLWLPRLPSREPLGLSIAGIAGVTALYVYFAVRWYQQRDYFVPEYNLKT
jgi:hypothetical protein